MGSEKFYSTTATAFQPLLLVYTPALLALNRNAVIFSSSVQAFFKKQNRNHFILNVVNHQVILETVASMFFCTLHVFFLYFL